MDTLAPQYLIQKTCSCITPLRVHQKGRGLVQNIVGYYGGPVSATLQKIIEYDRILVAVIRGLECLPGASPDEDQGLL